MITYDDKNVYEAAKDRIRFIYSLNRPVAVFFSGGKDSTALLHVTLEVAAELGIKKVPVVFLDQECEYTEAIRYVRKVMNMPEVEPYWIQVPFRLWNANNGQWFIPWEEGKEWMRAKEPDSYHDNVYGVDRFKDMFDGVAYYHFGENVIALGGVRIEESLARRAGLLNKEVLPGITWGKKGGKGDIKVLYPLYDWSFKDIWYYIFENKFDYCKIYNYLFSKVPLSRARVSSLIHENSNVNIPLLQEIDPVAYNAMFNRIPAIGTTNHLLVDMFETLSNYPACFNSWVDYLEYLVDNIVEPNNRDGFRRNLTNLTATIAGWEEKHVIDVYHTFARAIITEDFEMSKVANTLLKYRHKYKYGTAKKSNK